MRTTDHIRPIGSRELLHLQMQPIATRPLVPLPEKSVTYREIVAVDGLVRDALARHGDDALVPIEEGPLWMRPGIPGAASLGAAIAAAPMAVLGGMAASGIGGSGDTGAMVGLLFSCGTSALAIAVETVVRSVRAFQRGVASFTSVGPEGARALSAAFDRASGFQRALVGQLARTALADMRARNVRAPEAAEILAQVVSTSAREPLSPQAVVIADALTKLHGATRGKPLSRDAIDALEIALANVPYTDAKAARDAVQSVLFDEVLGVSKVEGAYADIAHLRVVLSGTGPTRASVLANCYVADGKLKTRLSHHDVNAIEDGLPALSLADRSSVKAFIAKTFPRKTWQIREVDRDSFAELLHGTPKQTELQLVR